MSDAFAYLSVLLSIILGLAIAEVLQGYGALLLFLIAGFVKDWLPDQSFENRMDLPFTAFFSAVTLIALTVRRPLVHEIIAPVMAVTITFYFLTLFMRI